MTSCVYALTTPAPRRLRATGVAGEPLRIVTFATISALVGELRQPPKPTSGNVRRYGETLQAVFAQTTALLPARFGTCLAGLDELEFILRSRRASLRSALGHVRNRAQMTVRVIAPAADGLDREPRLAALAAPHATALGHTDGRRQRPFATKTADTKTSGTATGTASRAVSRATAQSGADYLRERAADAVRARAIAGFEPVRAATARWVRDERVEKQPRLATVYHLVPRGSVDAYRSAVERAAASAGLHVVISGPWPPYAFAGW